MPKTQAEYFRDWESHYFGYGYGTGEQHTIPAIHAFLSLCKGDDPKSSMYDYRVLEERLTPTVAWLLINRLCDIDVIEYGYSPRFGWLTEKGERLRDFVVAHTPEWLIWTCRGHDEGYAHCSPNHCNCGYPIEAFDGNRVCDNPFWSDGRLNA